MGKLNDLIREAKRATILEVARYRHLEHIRNSVNKNSWWWHWAAVLSHRQQVEAACARLELRRYLRQRGLPTDHPCVPKTPTT